MKSDLKTQQAKKVRRLSRGGAALLVAGILFYCAAEPLARVYNHRDANGSVSTIDRNRRECIQNLGDKLSLLGVGLLVVGAWGWVNRSED